MSEAGAVAQHTDPRGFVVHALMSLLRGVVPAVAVMIGTSALGAIVVGVATLFGALISFTFSWIAWRHHTYLTGPEDIRVERGLFSRTARSVPYERIQDVSIEQKWLPRLFGLAEVRFETGAGGKDEVSLSYLSLAEAERLRELVRERKDGVPAESGEAAGDMEAVADAPSQVLFAMTNRRVALFGLFQFSLVVFAVLLGAAQQFDFLLPFEPWEWRNWRALLSGGEAQVAGLSHTAQAIAVVSGLLIVSLLGVATGVVRTFAREYGFTLERTAKGFRRRRGLFNKSDVLLPVHRVQAALVSTRLIRRRFGWYGLEFVSLAQDGAKTPHHAAAPFARLEEIWPLVAAAGMVPPAQGLAWHRPSPRPWLYDTLFHSLFFAALGAAISVGTGSRIPLALGGVAVLVTVLVNWLGWRRSRHALDATQLFHRHGTLAPNLLIAPRVKLQSAEITQSPLGRWRGYATLRLGLAGARLDLPGLPLEEAQGIRAQVLDSIARVDFSRLAA